MEEQVRQTTSRLLPFDLFRLSIWRIAQLFGLHLLLNGQLASEQHFLLTR
jgi:hypothetical protein